MTSPPSHHQGPEWPDISEVLSASVAHTSADGKTTYVRTVGHCICIPFTIERGSSEIWYKFVGRGSKLLIPGSNADSQWPPGFVIEGDSVVCITRRGQKMPPEGSIPIFKLPTVISDEDFALVRRCKVEELTEERLTNVTAQTKEGSQG